MRVQKFDIYSGNPSPLSNNASSSRMSPILIATIVLIVAMSIVAVGLGAAIFVKANQSSTSAATETTKKPPSTTPHQPITPSTTPHQQITPSSTQAKTTATATTTTAAPTKGFHDAADYLKMSMDTSADPCNDFYQYACGGWIKSHPLAPNQGALFTINNMQIKVYNDTVNAIQNLPANSDMSDAQQKTKVLFESCAESSQSQINHNKALWDLLEGYGGGFMFNATDTIQIGNITAGTFELGSWLGLLQGHHAVTGLLNGYVDVDGTASKYIFYLDQGDLDLGSALLYLNSSYNSTQQQYIETIYETLTLLGQDRFGPNVTTLNLKQRAQEIYEFEKDVARIMVPDEQRNNASQMYNTFTVRDAQVRWSTLNWTLYLAHVLPLNSSAHTDATLDLIDQNMEIVIVEPGFMDALNTLVNQTNPHIVANYLLWRLIDSLNMFVYSGTGVSNSNLRLKSKHDLPPGPMDCAGMLMQFVPLGVGRIFVDAQFPDQAKTEVDTLISNIQSAFREMLLSLTWLDDESKQKAVYKLNNTVRNAAYPEWIKDNSALSQYHVALQVNASDTWFNNYNSMVQWSIEKSLSRLWKTSVDREEFVQMSPATVDAEYLPQLNSITFPAGILQPPFFRLDYPKVVNYAGIGSVMGHETTHGFDNSGVQYDYNGRIHTFMDQQSIQGFTTMADCVQNEYNNFCFPDLHLCINGDATLPENIADNGAIHEAYLAYHNYISIPGNAEPKLPGLENYTDDQVFFLSMGTLQCGTQTPQSLQAQLLQVNDPHSPGKYRINGVMRNFNKFGEAFNCPRGSPMYPLSDNICSVWSNPPPPPPPGFYDAANYLKMSMNTSADPCNDFYEYACGGWIQNHPLAPNQGTLFAATYTQLKVYNDTINAIQNLPATGDISDAQQKTKVLFESCVESSQSQINHNKALWDLLEGYGGGFMFNATDTIQIGNITAGTFELGSWLGLLQGHHAVTGLLNGYVDVDGTASKYIFYLDQGDLDLGSALLYLNSSYNSTQQQYIETIYETLTLLGQDRFGPNVTTLNLKQRAQEIYEFEKDVARIMVPDEQRNNASQMYNTFTVRDAQVRWSTLNWTLYLAHVLPLNSSAHTDATLDLIDQNMEIVIVEPGFMDALNTLVNQTNPHIVANYLLWRLIDSLNMFVYNGIGFSNSNLRLKSKHDLPPGPMDCAGMLMQFVPLGVGRIFVDAQFPDQAKTEVDTLISNIQSAFREMLLSLTWLDDESKQKAVYKLNNTVRNAAYPEWIKDNSALSQYHVALQVNASDTWFNNYNSMVQWSIEKSLSRLWKTSVDREEFVQMSPATVDAEYLPQLNSITFPAGILQPPFFRMDYPKVVNYAGIGSVMGHETTHGFDNSGVQYDYNGSIHTFMDQQSIQGFKTMADCVQNEYNNFCFPDLHLCVNGDATLPENIADNGGIREAYQAYQNYIKTYGPEPELPLSEIGIYSTDKVFFISLASLYCGTQSPQSLQAQLLQVNDPHSPNKYRVNGVMRNFPKFGETFNCKRGTDPLYPASNNMCYVWSDPS